MKTILTIAAVLSLALFRTDIYAQNSILDPAIIQGVPPLMPMDGVKDNVNLINGNASFTIPLVHLKGRAGLDLDLGMAYNSKQMAFSSFPTFDDEGNTTGAISEWDPIRTGQPSGLQGMITIPSLTSANSYFASAGDAYPVYCDVSYVFTEGNGTPHSFLVRGHCLEYTPSGPIPIHDWDQLTGTALNLNTGTAGPDGSNITLDISNPNDQIVNLPSGQKFHFGGAVYGQGTDLNKIEDANGNYIQVSNTHLPISMSDPEITYLAETDFYDTLNRKVTVNWGAPEVPSSFPSITFNNSDGSLQTISTSQGFDATKGGGVPNPQLNAQCQTVNNNNQVVPIQIPYGGGTGWTSESITQQVNGVARTYTVWSNGIEITEVDLPDGGSIGYDGASYPGRIDYCTVDIREVSDRYVNSIPINGSYYLHPHQPGVSQIDTSYSAVLGTNPVQNAYGASTDIDINQTMEVWEYSFNGTSSNVLDFQPSDNGYTTSPTDTLHTFGGAVPNSGAVATAEVETDISDASSGYPLRKIVYSYSGAHSCGSVPTEVDTTLEDFDSGAQSTSVVQTDLMSDCSSVPAAVREYGYDGSLLRNTTYGYWNYPTFTDRVNSISITGSGGNSSSTTVEYDNYSRQGGMSPAALTNWDPAVTNAGNPTMTTTNGISTYSYYDYAGNVIKTIDGRGYSTTTSYADQWGDSSCVGGVPTWAYPTSVTNALNQTTNAWYNSCTGTASKYRDANQNYTQVSGYDALQRMQQINYPDGGQKQIHYVPSQGASSPSTVTVTILMSAQQSNIVQEKLDGLGRLVQYEVVSDRNGAVTTVNYDGFDNPVETSNPYGSGGTPSAWTGILYDALGRKIVQMEPDGVSVNQWYYSGNITTVTDPQWVERQYTTDAVGRVTKLIELGMPMDGVTLNLETDYTYDALGNLVTVQQLGNPSAGEVPVTRRFVYDSQSRLTKSCNPEMLPTGQLCDGVSNWSSLYGYDNNGNMTSRTDSRGVITTYGYDALNRLTSKSYSASSTNGVALNIAQTTAPIAYYYDGYNTVNQTVSNGIGRRTGISYEAGSGSWCNDPMGRVNNTFRLTQDLGKTYSYTYDLAGDVMTSPDGAFTYDGAERPISGWGVDGVSYTFNGSPQSMNRYLAGQLNGNFNMGAAYPTSAGRIGVNYTYTNLFLPLQITATIQGATGPATAVQQLTYSSAGNGNIVSITDGIHPNRSQQFNYDSLNRLSGARSCNGAPPNNGSLCSTSGSLWGETYAIDSFGNLTQRNPIAGVQLSQPIFSTSVVPGSNRLNGYNYDEMGSVLSDGIHSYTYDAENRLRSVDSYIYMYDGDGQRVVKADMGGGLKTNYYYGIDGKLRHEDNDNNATSVDMTYFNGQMAGRYVEQNGVINQVIYP